MMRFDFSTKQPDIEMTDRLKGDSQVALHARDVIARHAHFRGRADQFEFECCKSVLIIRGQVPTFYLKQLLQDALKRVDGIRRIENRVEVTNANGLSSVVHR
jgi:hypothetical protein